MARKPFKLRSSPAKGLSDFFSSIGAKKTGDIGEKLRKKYSTKAQDAGEVPRHGESKYQFNVRRKREARKADKPRTDVLTREITDTSDLTTEQRASLGEKVYPQRKPKSKTTKTTKTIKTTKPDFTKAPKVGTQKRRDWYTKNKLKQDDTTKIGKTAKIKEKRPEYVTR